MKIWSGYFELDQFKWLVSVGLRAFRRDGLGNLRMYGCVVDSVGVTFVHSLFMGNFCSFRIRRSVYIRDSLFLILFYVLILIG